jgi:hypothetical protein
VGAAVKRLTRTTMAMQKKKSIAVKLKVFQEAMLNR